MDFGFDDKTSELQQRLLEFMDECVYPAEARFRRRSSRLTTHGEPRPCSRSSRPRHAGAACGTCSCPGPTSSGQD